MTTRVVRVRPETPFKEMVRLLRVHGVNALPVTDDRGHVLGVVSATDLALKQERPPGERAPLLERLARHHERRKAGATTAADCMTSPAVTVTPDVPVRTAARLLHVHGIHHLPVVADGELVGMVTRRDLLAAFLREDEEVRRQIAHGVLEMTFHLSADQVAVTVHNGVVRLTGNVELRSVAEEIERFVAALDGVVAVESKLQWEVDDRVRVATTPWG